MQIPRSKENSKTYRRLLQKTEGIVIPYLYGIFFLLVILFWSLGLPIGSYEFSSVRPYVCNIFFSELIH